jgi:hypothetical protein
MTAVYHKIIKIKPANPRDPTKEIDVYLQKNPGVDYNILQNTPAVGVTVIEFICSDKNPKQEKSMKDIDNLIKGSKLHVLKEMDTHDKDPLNKANHLVRISDEQNNELERA